MGGGDIVRYKAPDKLEVTTDISDEDVQTIRAVRSFTMTSPERIQALCAAVRYVVAANIPGAIVECGVWRGGSMMAAALTLLECNDTKRDLFLLHRPSVTAGSRGVEVIDRQVGRQVVVEVSRAVFGICLCGKGLLVGESSQRLIYALSYS